jgi:hypothetical protein
VIQGDKTLQARTSHYIAVDPVHDELAVPNPFAQAILFFRGGINTNEAPIRVIQGPKTMLSAVDNVAVDPTHNEVFTASFPNDAIFVFKRDAGGDVAPVRIIHGPKTQLDRPIRVDVDPLNNIIAVVNDHNILFFDRTANGDVGPKWVLGGTRLAVGARNGTRDVRLYGEGKKIITSAAVREPGQSAGAQAQGGQGGNFGRGRGQRMIGVWQYGDTGDTMPWAALNSTPTTNIPGSRLAINPKGGDLIVGGDGQVSVYHLPEIFQRPN